MSIFDISEKVDKMKKFTRIMLLVIALLFICAQVVWSAGAVTTYTTTYIGYKVYKHTFAWTGDGAGGAVNSFTTPTVTGYVFSGITNPGTATPTDNYDITLSDAHGVDVFGGELLNRDEANSEQATPKIGNAYGTRFVNSKLTFAISGQSANSATGVLDVYVYVGD